jgi:hypothetical protein
MSAASPMPMRYWSLVRFRKRKTGPEQKRFGPFYISSHAVVGRLSCLSAVPALVIIKVTPSPE